MELEWLTPLQLAEKWGITKRQAQILCSQGKVAGAIKVSEVWLIPKDAPRPVDGRTREAKAAKTKIKRENAK